ncbi:MAG: alpha/beta fold hydrolase [Phycisphaerae bacterium]|jgi:esterase/lipase
MRKPLLISAIAICSATILLPMGCIIGGPWDPGEVNFGLSRLILHPEYTCADLRERFQLSGMELADNPADIGMEYEEYWLPVDDGISLRTWYLPAKLDRGLVVVSCGNTGPMECYLFSAQILTDNGWSAVMYDYEGFGESGGEPSLDTLRRDLETVLDWARSRTGRSQVTLFGMSLGSIPSVTVAVERPDAVNAVVLDSPVALGAQIERFGFVVAGKTEWITGQLNVDLLSDELIQWLDQPLLIYLHEQDPIATADSVELLFNRAAGPKQIVRFPELGHASSQFFSTDSYIYYLEHFLANVWLPPTDALEMVAQQP